MPIKPNPMSHDELADLLESIAAAVRAHDSLEGNISWELPYDEPGMGDCLVAGSFRIGNRMGQGGMRFVGEIVTDVPSSLDPPSRQDTTAEHYEDADGEDANGYTIRCACGEEFNDPDNDHEAVRDLLAKHVAVKTAGGTR